MVCEAHLPLVTDSLMKNHSPHAHLTWPEESASTGDSTAGTWPGLADPDTTFPCPRSLAQDIHRAQVSHQS